jgi:hypothetical protein
MKVYPISAFGLAATLRVAALCVIAAATDARAQEPSLLGPPAIEAVASITTSSSALDDPFLFFDLAATFPIGDRFGAIVRPYAHRLAGGEWAAEMYQLQLRYQSATRIPVRVDAGIISSPIGLGTLELRADQSAAIKPPFYYHMPLPPFEPGYHGVQLVSGGYPLGVITSVSGNKWDARAGFTDSTPALERNVFAEDRPDAMRQFVAGGGFTPIAGLRFGAGFAQGAYRSREALAGTSATSGSDVTIFNVEAEYAVRHTKFSGEWIRNRFDSTLEPAVARGYFVQAVHAFTPRLFGTVRVAGASAPAYTGLLRVRRNMTSAELSAGWRLTHNVTVRGGYYASRRFGSPTRSHTAVASLVWARRWF